MRRTAVGCSATHFHIPCREIVVVLIFYCSQAAKQGTHKDRQAGEVQLVRWSSVT